MTVRYMKRRYNTIAMTTTTPTNNPAPLTVKRMEGERKTSTSQRMTPSGHTNLLGVRRFIFRERKKTTNDDDDSEDDGASHTFSV